MFAILVLGGGMGGLFLATRRRPLVPAPFTATPDVQERVTVDTGTRPVAAARPSLGTSWARLVSPEELDAEARDPVWAPGMEAAVRRTVVAGLANLDGAEIAALECRTSACRLVIRITANLKERLLAHEPQGGAFATSQLVLRRGGLAPSVAPTWLRRTEGPTWWRELTDFARGAQVFLGRDPWADLLEEESILSFSPETHDPPSYLRWVERTRENQTADPASP